MSNKDGEDTLRRQRHNAAIRILEDEDEEYKLNCICTLLGSQQELASLREQLDIERNKVGIWIKELQFCQNLLKQQEEVIRELIPIAEWKLKSTSMYLNDFEETTETEPQMFNECGRLKSLIEKAKSLTTKDK